MSEESFEEIQMDRSWTGPSISGQESNSAQHATNESPTISSTNPMEAAELKGIEFELTWETRDEIISTISQHTKLLNGLIIDSYARERMRKANGDLVSKLMNLPLKVDGRLNGFGSFSRLGGGPNDVVLDLNQETRSRIIDTLMGNHQITLEAHSVSSECKSRLIDENNDLISELLKLKSRVLPINKPSFGPNASPSYPVLPQQQPWIPPPMPPPMQSPMQPPMQPWMPPPMQPARPSTETTNLYSPLNVNQDQPWHQQFPQGVRSVTVQKIVTAILPSPDPKAAQDPRMNELIQYAQKVESSFYKAAKSSKEYYQLIAERIWKIQKELEEKRVARKKREQEMNQQQANQQQANQQQPLNPIGSATNGSSLITHIKEEPGTVKASTSPDSGAQATNVTNSATNNVTNSVTNNSTSTHNDREFKPEELRKALMPTLEKMYKQDPESVAFRKPVDPVLLNIPDYLTIVKKPMDLSTIKKKLDDGQYTDPWQYVDDVWLMLENAWLYNHETSKIYKCTTKMKEVFEAVIDPAMQSLGFCCGGKLPQHGPSCNRQA